MNPSLERGSGTPRFSGASGPFLRLIRRLHLARSDGSPRAWALCAIAWIPLCVGALLRLAAGRPVAPILFDLSVHTRLLIALPLVIQAERLLERRTVAATDMIYLGKFAEPRSLDRVVDRAARLRDSRLVELVIFIVAVLGGQASLFGLFGPTGLFTGVSDAGSVSFARIWYVAVAFPIVQFLLLRWLWHWLAWSYLVVRLSRLRLTLIATHPDHAGGIGFLSAPLSAFAVLVLAVASTMAAAWATQILDGRASVQSVAPTFVVFVVLVFVVGCGPLLAYMGALYRARVRDVARYSGLALDYVRDFDRKWIETRTEPLLGTPDLQSMADLCNTYEQLVKIRLVPFGPRPVAGIWVAALIPMLPLVATTMPVDEMLLHIGRTLLGGFPA